MKSFQQFLYECYFILEKKEEDDDNGHRSPEARALLDAIAGSESPDYRTVYGGSKFDDYKDHPRRDIRIRSGPNAGLTSNAAGRYQFLSTTWDDVAKQRGLKDFTPDSQDRGAWHLARRTYGGSIRQDLRKDPLSVASKLSGQWTSLPGGIERNAATDSFEKRYRESLAKYERETQQPSTPTPTPIPTSAPKPATPAPQKTFTKTTIADKGGKGGTVSTHTAYQSKLGGTKATVTRGDTGTQVIRAKLAAQKPSNPIAALFKPKAGSTETATLGGVKGKVTHNKDGTRSFTAIKPAAKPK
jgi:muramidase (phage lysozyme)